MVGFDRANYCRQIGMKGGLATKAKFAPNGENGYYSAIAGTSRTHVWSKVKVSCRLPSGA